MDARILEYSIFVDKAYKLLLQKPKQHLQKKLLPRFGGGWEGVRIQLNPVPIQTCGHALGGVEDPRRAETVRESSHEYSFFVHSCSFVDRCPDHKCYRKKLLPRSGEAGWGIK
jgi:hypothetical protein